MKRGSAAEEGVPLESLAFPLQKIAGILEAFLAMHRDDMQRLPHPSSQATCHGFGV